MVWYRSVIERSFTFEPNELDRLFSLIDSGELEIESVEVNAVQIGKRVFLS